MQISGWDLEILYFHTEDDKNESTLFYYQISLSDVLEAHFCSCQLLVEKCESTAVWPNHCSCGKSMKNNEHNLYIDRRKIIFRVDKTTSVSLIWRRGLLTIT